jgi:D-amino-acid dehydrogenase
VSAPAEIVVVGGGVVGLACAFNLQREGAKVLLVDHRAQTPPASFGNAGHLAAEQTAPLASPAALRSAVGRLFGLGGALDFRLSDIGAWGPWARRYLAACTDNACAEGGRALKALLTEAMPAWRRLAGAVGEPGLVIERGHYVVWESARTAAAGRSAWRAADIGPAKAHDLTSAQLAELATSLRTPVADGLAFRGTGQVQSPARVLEALRTALREAGGDLVDGQAVQLDLTGRGVEVLLADGMRLRPRTVVVAGGVGSGALMRTAGHAAPVIAERGYHIEGEADGWGDLPPVAFEDRSMILTRFGSRLRAASFVEFGRAAAPPDRRKWERLRRHLRELGVGLCGEVSEWMGARPTMPDYLPAIGRSARAPGLLYAFGHQHLGLTLAAVTGELVAALAAGTPPAVDLAPFDLDRFQPSMAGRQPSASLSAVPEGVP